jgi:hypothetical protein
MSFLIVKDATRKESYLKVVEKPRSRLLLGHTTNGQICLYLSKQSTRVLAPYFTRQHLHLTKCPLILILKSLLDAATKRLLIYWILLTLEPKQILSKYTRTFTIIFLPWRSEYQISDLNMVGLARMQKKPTMILLYPKSKCSISHMLSRQTYSLHVFVT